MFLDRFRLRVTRKFVCSLITITATYFFARLCTTQSTFDELRRKTLKTPIATRLNNLHA